MNKKINKYSIDLPLLLPSWMRWDLSWDVSIHFTNNNLEELSYLLYRKEYTSLEWWCNFHVSILGSSSIFDMNLTTHLILISIDIMCCSTSCINLFIYQHIIDFYHPQSKTWHCSSINFCYNSRHLKNLTLHIVTITHLSIKYFL